MDPRNQGNTMEQGGQATGKYPVNRAIGDQKPLTSENVGELFATNASATGRGVAHQLQIAATDFGKVIIDQLPNSRERELALTKLQECWFFLNQGVISYL